MDRPVVELTDAVAVLGSFPALAGASLVVQQGEIVLLRGPNGAGKTTLLRVCAGLLPLARGTGVVLGCDLATERDAVRRRVGLLGHRNGLYLDLTVAENVRFWGATVRATDDEIAAAMDRLGLSGRLAPLPVRQLSAGQQRRTALACLVARRAELWLLDEPHAGLDATGRDELDATLRQAAASGATVIVASHELERAGSLATRCVDVVAGQVIGGAMKATLRTAWLMARKDLRVEWRSHVALNQILPFAAITMVLFAFAVDRLPAAPGDVDTVLVQLAPGLASLGTVFSLLLLVQRTFAVESEDGALDALRAAGVEATAVFWGKTLAMWIQLAILSALLLGTAVVIYGIEVRWSGVVLLITTWLTATFGLAAVGTLYGGLAAGARGRETLLPLLLLPVVAPVLIGATRAVEAALGTGGTAIADGWPWVGVVAVFAVAFGAGGTLAFGPLIDE